MQNLKKLTQEEIIEILKKTGVMLEGHFVLTSGKHSDKYMQCAKLFQYPLYSEQICALLAEKFTQEENQKIDLVVGPAVGGIIVAYQTAQILGARNIFAERQDKKMTFRRGFEVKKGERVLVVEDVVTTGGSVQEVVDLLVEMGAQVVGVGSIVDRSKGKAKFSVPFKAVIQVDFNVYEADSCEICKTSQTNAISPGSRNI